MQIKKHGISILWLLAGFAAGVLLTLLCWIVREKAEERQRFRDCLNYDYSFLNLADARAIEEDEQGSTYYFDGVTFRQEGEETLVFDNWSGQMRQYHKGVLFLLFTAEYGRIGPDYQQPYQVRSLEDCESLSLLLEEGDTAGLKEAGGRVWQTESGKTFVD